MNIPSTQYLIDRGSDLLDQMIEAEGIDAMKILVANFLQARPGPEHGAINTLVSYAMFLKIRDHESLMEE